MSAALERFRSLYGSSPLHLIAVIASFVIAFYAASKIAQSDARWNILLWFLGAVLLHDLVLFPLYTVLDRIAGGRRPRAAINYLRVPVLLSGLLFLLSAGLILGAAQDSYESATGLRPEPYLERWLVITAVLFVASGILYAVRARRRA
jgi:FtsH-binding integral membrane protein